MPMMVMVAVRGCLAYRPRMSSISREPMACSMAPTHRNSSDLEMAWKMISSTAAVMASGVLRPAQHMISPRLETVE